VPLHPTSTVRKTGHSSSCSGNWRSTTMSGRPVGGRFIPASEKQLRLHPDIDETRVLVIEDMMYSGGLARLGYVEGTNPVSDAQLRDHPGEYAYRTDGLCAVLFIISRPLSLSDVEILDWVMPSDTRQTR